MPDSSFEEMLEKLCIINHLFERDFELYMHFNQGKSLFEQLWDGKFKGQDFSKLREKYEIANQEYRAKLRQLFQDDNKVLRHTVATGRLFIETYEDMNERFET
jgi:hypothetical protein